MHVGFQIKAVDANNTMKSFVSLTATPLRDALIVCVRPIDGTHLHHVDPMHPRLSSMT